MLFPTELGSIPIELSETEFREQVNSARNIVSAVYEKSTPLLMLGYNGAQIRALNYIFSAVEDGEATDAKWNLNYPFYRHYARFEAQNGYLDFEFSGNSDFQIVGEVNELVEKRDNFPIGTNPHLYLLKRRQQQDIELRDLSERIFRGKFTGEANMAKRTLAKIPAVKEIPSVRDSYQTQWLDEDTKMDAVFYFPARNEYVVFRKIVTRNGYEIWGKRKNVNSQQIKEALEEKSRSKALVFQLAPQPAGNR